MKSLFGVLCVIGAVFFVPVGFMAFMQGAPPKAGGLIIVVGLALFGAASLLLKKSGGKKSDGLMPW